MKDKNVKEDVKQLLKVTEHLKRVKEGRNCIKNGYYRGDSEVFREGRYGERWGDKESEETVRELEQSTEDSKGNPKGDKTY